MTESHPLVSAVIPTYNRAHFLTEAIESILNQGYSRVEILIADDGSTDDTEAQVTRFRHPDIRYLKLPHSGRPSVTRNRALAEARGTLVALLDDDDVWQPNKLARQVECMTANPETGFVYTDGRLRWSDGSLSGSVLRSDEKQRGAIFDALLTGCFVHPSTLMIRKTLLDRVGWFDEELPIVEDYDLVLRLAYAAQAELLDLPLVHVRRHDAGISRLRDLTTYEQMLIVLNRLPSRFGLTPIQHLRVRRALARTHAQLSLRNYRIGRVTTGHFHVRKALRLNPLQRLAWQALLTRR